MAQEVLRLSLDPKPAEEGARRVRKAYEEAGAGARKAAADQDVLDRSTERSGARMQAMAQQERAMANELALLNQQYRAGVVPVDEYAFALEGMRREADRLKVTAGSELGQALGEAEIAMAHQAIAARELASAQEAVDYSTRQMVLKQLEAIQADEDRTRSMVLMHMEALRMNAAVDAAGATSGRSAVGLGRLSGSLTSVLRQAIGVHPVFGQLANVLGSFALGATMMVGVLAGLAAMAVAWRLATRDAREHREALEEARATAARFLEDTRGKDPTVQAVETFQEDIRLRNERIRQLGWVEGSDPAIARLREQNAAVQREIDELETARASQQRSRNLEGTREREEASFAVVRGLRDEVAERERLGAAMTRGHAAYEAELALVERERAIREALVGVLPVHRGEVIALTNAHLDETKAIEDRIAAMERLGNMVPVRQYSRYQSGLAPGELRREVPRPTRIGGPDEETRAEIEQERLTLLREQVREQEMYARSAIQVSQALGLVDSASAAAISNIVQVANAIKLIDGGDTTAGWASLAGGVAGIVGAIFGGESRRDQVIEQNTRAIEENTRRLSGQGTTAAQYGQAGRAAQAIVDQDIARIIPTGPGSGRAHVARQAELDAVLAASGLTWKELNAIAKELGVTLDIMSERTFQQLVEQTQLWIDELNRLEAIEMRNLDVRALQAQGRDREADALRLQLDQEEEIRRAQQAGYSDAYIARLMEVHAMEEQAAIQEEVARQIRNVSSALNAPDGLRLSLARWQAEIHSSPPFDPGPSTPDFEPGRVPGPPVYNPEPSKPIGGGGPQPAGPVFNVGPITVVAAPGQDTRALADDLFREVHRRSRAGGDSLQEQGS